MEDRRGRDLSKEEIEHFMEVAAAIKRTIKMQKKIDEVMVKDPIR